MGERKRHHFVPRFWLNRFASSRRGDTYLVHRVCADGSVQGDLSTQDVCVEKHFYGKEAEGLEQLFSDAEKVWSKLFREVDAGTHPAAIVGPLWHAVYMLTFRIAGVREAWVAMGHGLMQRLGSDEGTAAFREGLSKASDAYLDEQADEVLGKLLQQPHLAPHRERIMAILEAKWPEIRQLIRHQLASDETVGLLRTIIGGVSERVDFEGITKSSHNKALRSLIVSPTAPQLAPIRWEILADPERRIFLGDSPVLGVGELATDLGALWKHGAKYTEFYMPLDPSRVLVGVRHDGPLHLDIDRYLEAAAAICQEYFCAATDSSAIRAIASRIGTNWQPLSEQEMDEIVRETATRPPRSARTEL